MPTDPIEFTRDAPTGDQQRCGNRVQLEDANAAPYGPGNPLPIAPAPGALTVVQIADGADVTQGALADVAVTTDAAGSVSAKLRGLIVHMISLLARLPAALGANGGLKIEGVAGGVPVPVHGGLADNTAAAGNPMAIGALADETAPGAATEGRLGWLRMTLYRLLRITDGREPGAAALHRTITALWGKQPPLSTDANWSANPGQRSRARFLTDLVVRGCTALLDDPIITFRPYIRNGAYVAAAETVSYTRSRLKDLNTIKFLHTHDNGANYTDDSAAVIDNNAATQSDLDALDTLANLDYFVIGGPVPFMGAALDMDAANVNANAATLVVEYASHATAGVIDGWTAVTNLTDGTIAVATKTLSGDGQISWGMPAAGAWVAGTLPGAGAPVTSCYWIRCSVSAAISANVDVEECDLLMPIRAAIDVQVDGDDAILTLMSQDVAVTGTVAYSGSIYLSWR
jgi:hypothetical protein